MKKSINLLTATLLSAMFSVSCHVDNAKVVETEKETTDCVVGKWMPENEDKELNDLEFHTTGIKGSDNGTINLTGGFEASDGVWQYKSIGEVEISTAARDLNFKLLNCKRGILDGLTIYVKE